MAYASILLLNQQTVPYCSGSFICTGIVPEPDSSVPGISAFNVYYKNSFLLKTTAVSHLDFCATVDVTFADNLYIKGYTFYRAKSESARYCRAWLFMADGTKIQYDQKFNDPYEFTVGDYKFVPVR